MAGEIKEKVIGLRVDSETEKYLDLAVRHDYLLFKDKGLKRENLSEWVRFLINSRITQIIGTKKGG